MPTKPDRDLDPYRYTEKLLELFREAHQREHSALREALLQAQKDVDRRLEAMNHLREQINAERSTYLPREVYDREHRALADRVTFLEQVTANFQGRLWMLGAFVGLATAIITWIVRK
jgi:hypothetical protein